MALQSSPPSSSSSSSYGFSYDVFLSFRGTDTRYGFTGDLYNALDSNGIRTFIDDIELHRGDEITPSLVKAIEESRIFIPVFSINYASSSFCLDELVHIVECSKARGRLVLPIFYGVGPSHVRHQTDSYGEDIAYHEQRFQNNVERLQKWKMALYQVANLSGYDFKIGNEYEHKFIGNIVKYVSNKISRVPLHVADYPIGLESRVLHVTSLLDERSDDGVDIIGIYGTGGVGKTTLAKAIYNFIADQFECLCFLYNVRENSAKHGLKHLQEMLLSKTVGLDIKLGDVSEGIPIIKQRLHRKKVLLILDDVDKLKQLQVLAGGLDWFGLSSKVIITTRDKHLLASHEIERTYEVYGLNGEEALELLRWKAFKNNRVDSSYEDILNRAIAYASGLPLAIEILGSDLFEKPIEHWKSTLDRYGKIPNKEIQKILKVSFDALEKDEQSVFLDIACCFKGHRLAEVEDILHAHYGDNMKSHIGVLVEKSLIKIDKCQWSYTYNQVTLHDLIGDMGKEIVRQESPIEPGKRSRLWFGDDIVHVLQENTGTSEIEIIYLDCPSIEEVDCNRKAFKKMKNLKTLVIESGHFFEGPTHFPSSLRVLVWKRYPSQCLPSNFQPEKLAICNLSNCRFTSFELTSSLHKKFVNLKFLNFDYCDNLIHIPDISGIPNLEEFSFENCRSLLTIHNSVGHSNKLKRLNAWGCRKLRSFPSIKLTSLQELELSFCECLESFPEMLEEMQHLTRISLFGTSIKEFPFSFQNLTWLHSLTLQGNGMLRLSSSIFMMPNLLYIGAEGFRLSLPKENDKLSSMVFSNVQSLMLRKCNLTDEFLPVLTWFANVKSLDLSENNFTILSECIEECRFLRILHLDDCKYLREIRGIPPNLDHLSALGCKLLTSWCRSILLNQQLHEAGSTDFCLPSRNERIPEWFEHQCRGPSISFWFRNSAPSVALLVATKSMHNKCSEDEYLQLRVRINGYECTLPDFGLILEEILPDHTYLSHLRLQLGNWVHADSVSKDYQEFLYELEKSHLKNEWIHVEVMLTGPVMESVLVEAGMHVLKKKSSIEDIQFTNPFEEKRELDKLGEIPILHAELKTILYGIQFFWNRGYRKVIVESNCLYAIELLRKERPPPDFSCWNLVREIHIFSSSIGEVDWGHTSRERNWAANGFAKHGLELSRNRGLVIFDDVPRFILEIWKGESLSYQLEFLFNYYTRMLQRHQRQSSLMKVWESIYLGLHIHPFSPEILKGVVEVGHFYTTSNKLRWTLDNCCYKKPSVVVWLFALSYEMSRGGSNHIIHGLFERALGNDMLCSSVVLWHCYIVYELNIAHDPSTARRVFFPAIHACPWSKQL